jgi:hypothetical protein
MGQMGAVMFIIVHKGLAMQTDMFSPAALSFAASGLPSRTRSKLSGSNHSHSYALSSENFAWHACSAPYIRNPMKYPG